MKIGADNVNCPVKTNKWGKDNVWRNIKEIKSGVSNAWRSVWKRAVELIRTFTTKADFDTCTLTDTVATEAGDVELATGSTGKNISSLPVGTKVRASNTKYNGAVIGFVVGHQASGRTKLIAEKIITLKCFDAIEASNPNSDRANYGNNRYSQSNIDQWLNSAAGAGAWYSARHTYDAPPNNANTWNNYNEYDAEAGFLANFEEPFRNAILDSTIRVVKNTVTDGSGYEDIIRKVYLLSNTEVGLANENGVAEGTKWDLFSDDNSRMANPTAEAVSTSEYTSSGLNASSPWSWWLRTPEAGTSHDARRVGTDGTLGGNYHAFYGISGVRPALELPNDIVVSETPDEDGYYTISFISYAQSGTIESPAIDLSPAGAAETSKIEFSTTTPTGTTATVQTALSTDGGTTYDSWQTATSGAAIPGLAAGADVSNTRMKWKATLSTNDVAVTPKLRNVTVKLNKGM